MPENCGNCGETNVNIEQFLEPAGFRVDWNAQPHADTDQAIYVEPKAPKVSVGDSFWQPLLQPDSGRVRASHDGYIYHHSRGSSDNGYEICLECGRAGEAGSEALKDHRPLTPRDNRTSERCLGNDEGYGHQDVWVRGYVNEVVIGCRGEIIARHPRCWEREDVVFDPVHYLPLIEQKINSLDQAAPLQGWDLPQEFATLRRLMEGRMAKHGRREYVQVLRLLESFELADLHAAVKQAIQLGAIGFDAVKHLILCRVERRPPRLDLSIYPYLPRATVETTSAKAYMRLLSSDAGEAA